MYVSVHTCMWETEEAIRMVFDTLELELQAVFSHLSWVLGAVGPLQKQCMLLTTDLSFQPQRLCFFVYLFHEICSAN